MSDVFGPSQVHELEPHVEEEGPHYEEYHEHDEIEDVHDDVQPDVEEEEEPELDSYSSGPSDVCVLTQYAHHLVRRMWEIEDTSTYILLLFLC